MSKKFLSGINVTGTATLNTVANAGLDTDKFLVLDAAGNVDFRTGDELKADIGADVVSRIEHEVKLGETMTIGTPVYIGVDLNAGTNMTVYKATNATEAGSSKTLGLIASSGITNDLVEVVTEGLLAGLNTSTATKGDPVWLGVNGALIFGLANKPVAPAHMVFLGIVTRVQSNNGEIFVKVQNGFEMNEIHNYLEGSVQNNEVIVYESATSLYKPKSIPAILGYTPVPNSRTITINGTSYDLSENRAWTITTDASARSILRYVATAGQTTFTISGGYTPGLTDVYRNGVKLDNSTDFTATNGTTIVLTNGASVNDVIEVYRYQTAFLANNALRVVTEFIATAGQTTFSVTYNSGLVDVFYNGSKLVSSEYTAGNGTTIVLNFPCNVNDSVAVHAYSYQVGAFSGQAQLNGTGFVKANGTTITYDNSTYLTSINSSQVTTALGYTPYNATNPSGYITSSALSSYLPLAGGTLTGALNGTSASFSNIINGQLGFLSGIDNGAAARGYLTNYQNHPNSRAWRIIGEQTEYADFQIQQATTKGGSTYANILRFSANGSAVFSSNISAINTASTVSIVATGINSGAAGGSSIISGTNGVTNIAIGNRSALLGGGFDSTSMIYWGNGGNLVFNNGSDRVTISSTGISTFANSIITNGSLSTVGYLNYNSGDGNEWYINPPSNGPTIRLKYHGGSTNRSGGLGWVDNAGGRTEALTWQDDTVTLNGTSISPRNLGKSYVQTSGGGSGTANIDTGITYNSGDFGGYGRGATYEVVVGANPNAGGSGAYYSMYFGIVQVYTGWSGSAVTTYISYTSLAAANGGGNLTVSATFWNGSSETTGVGVYTTGYQIRIKVSGYNSSYTGQDQVVYLKRIS